MSRRRSDNSANASTGWWLSANPSPLGAPMPLFGSVGCGFEVFGRIFTSPRIDETSRYANWSDYFGDQVFNSTRAIRFFQERHLTVFPAVVSNRAC